MLSSRSFRLISILAVLLAQPSLAYPRFIPFEEGEKITFSVEYGFIKAGTAILEVRGVVDLDGTKCYHIVSEERTTPFFSRIFRIEDRYESFVDREDLSSIRYEKHIRQGDYQADQVVEFDRERGVAVYNDGREVEILPGAKDIIASIYHTRTLDLDVGKSVMVNNHTDGKNYSLEIEILRREEITTPAGKFNCMVLRLNTGEMSVFASKGGLTMWVTDDLWKIPVLIRSKIFIGSLSAVVKEISFGS